MAQDRPLTEPLILRDHLAIDRTHLANERTLLAYLRTAIMLLVSGVTLIKLFANSTAWVVSGYTLMVTAAAMGIFGFTRFSQARRSIAAEDHGPQAPLIGG